MTTQNYLERAPGNGAASNIPLPRLRETAGQHSSPPQTPTKLSRGRGGVRERPHFIMGTVCSACFCSENKWGSGFQKEKQKESSRKNYVRTDQSLRMGDVLSTHGIGCSPSIAKIKKQTNKISSVSLSLSFFKINKHLTIQPCNIST